MPTSRRRMLRQAAALAGWGALTPTVLNLSALTQAAAQSSSGDYRALVCVFLLGGNDAFNMVLATDSTSWQHYRNQRDPSARNPADTSDSIALLAAGTAATPTASASSPQRLGGVLPISHGGRAVNAGRTFALHPALQQTQQLYEAGRMAVLANVGPLTRPLTKADYSNTSISKPPKLFSHNDQQSCWQSFQPEGAAYGWGGRLGDMLTRSALAGAAADSDAALALQSFTCLSPGNAAVWLAGQNIRPFLSSKTAILELGTNKKVYGSSTLHTAMSAIMGAALGTNRFVQAHSQLTQRAFRASALLSSKLPALGVSPWSSTGVTNVYQDSKLLYTPPSTGSPTFSNLALQLQMVARLIEANRVAGLGLTRQLFFVTLDGFDTHDRQIAVQGDRMAELDHAFAYFDATLAGMPSGDMRSKVTTFTASEFGRTFTSNGDGTDHGWGSHHFIMGGAVKGTDVYGTFPQFSTADSNGTFSSADQLANGVLLPSTSVDQYAATLGRWMGVSSGDLLGILPNLGQFSTQDLGFMTT